MKRVCCGGGGWVAQAFFASPKEEGKERGGGVLRGGTGRGSGIGDPVETGNQPRASRPGLLGERGLMELSERAWSVSSRWLRVTSLASRGGGGGVVLPGRVLVAFSRGF